MSQEERGAYLAQVGPAIEGLLAKGVEIVSWGVNEDSTHGRAGYDYFAIWNFPNEELVKEFEAIVEGAGWYNQFSQL